MNNLMVRGQVNQVRGELRQKWCRFTGDNFGRLNGRILKLKGKVQCRYGRAKAVAGKRFRKFTRH